MKLSSTCEFASYDPLKNPCKANQNVGSGTVGLHG